MLGLSNTLISTYNRVTTILIDETFEGSSVGGFTGINATISNSSQTLSVASTASGGYARQSFATTPNTTYSYSIKLTATGLGGGTIKIGTSPGDDTFGSKSLSTVKTYTGTFTTTASSTFLSLVVTNNSQTLKFDDIVLKENN